MLRETLRGALRTSPVLSPGGVAPLIVSDATAALTALQEQPGLPAGGVVLEAVLRISAGDPSLSEADMREAFDGYLMFLRERI